MGATGLPLLLSHLAQLLFQAQEIFLLFAVLSRISSTGSQSLLKMVKKEMHWPWFFTLTKQLPSWMTTLTLAQFWTLLTSTSPSMLMLVTTLKLSVGSAPSKKRSTASVMPLMSELSALFKLLLQ